MQIIKNQSGFSFIGVIVALTITSVSIVAILVLINTSLRVGNKGKMSLMAAGLAQEGIELIRDMRKSEADWDDWYSSVSSGDYLVQHDSGSLLSFSETPLKLDNNTGLYQYDDGANSPFYRKVTLTKVSANEIKALIEVKWSFQESWQYLTAENKLWNWK